MDYNKRILVKMQKQEQDYLSNLLKSCNIEEALHNNFFKFLNFLLKENENLNIISRKLTIKALIEDHFYDCLAGFYYFREYASIADLGSGGGFPGLLLGITFPDKKIILVEKSPKKSAYLQKAVEYLTQKNITIINGDLQKTELNSALITCRAFKSIINILELTENHYNSTKPYLLYKATQVKINEEIEQALKKYKFNFKIIKIAEKLNKERNLIWIQKDE